MLKLILKLARSHLDVPLLIFRSGVLRQGSDKFYEVSFQARHSFLVIFVNL
jgi:hypothetical protein